MSPGNSASEARSRALSGSKLTVVCVTPLGVPRLQGGCKALLYRAVVHMSLSQIEGCGRSWSKLFSHLMYVNMATRLRMGSYMKAVRIGATR